MMAWLARLAMWQVHAGLSAAQIIVKVAHENLRPPVPRM